MPVLILRAFANSKETNGLRDSPNDPYYRNGLVHSVRGRERVAVCCSVLQCAAVCCSVLQCAAVFYSVLQYEAEIVTQYLVRRRMVTDNPS